MIRALFLSDTHLGFDMPAKPRTSRRRRGPDFWRSFRAALQPALRGEVDVVLHGGDVFYRSRVQAGLVQMAIDMILEVTGRGIPFLVVPGNHERSVLPFPLLWSHPLLHVFDRPRTYEIDIGTTRVSFSGFPSIRNGIRSRFSRLVESTGWTDGRADIRLLCMHQTVQGATAGPSGYVFREGEDIIPLRVIPCGFAAVLSGHFHPHQVIEGGSSPVIYPGSTERTSFAEKKETKGCMILEFEATENGGGRLLRREFLPLDCRPMVDLELRLGEMDFLQAGRELERSLGSLDPDSIVRISIESILNERILSLFRVTSLRKIAPGMNISLRRPRSYSDTSPET